MNVLHLSGSHEDMGRQHACQVRDLRPHILMAVQRRLDALARLGANLSPYLQEIVDLWAEMARPTLAMLRGIVDGLGLEWEPFFRYTLASYLEDRLRGIAVPDGCTVWAAAAPVTRDGAPILAKNRDYRPEHQALQCLARVHPARGYRYACITSAGSPGVFSSGINEAGLAVADTHVTSLDTGPGLARCAVMMEVLEHHATVASALDYLRSVPHLGDGTLVLADAGGDMAVFEAGHSAHGVVEAAAGFVVATNHFVTSHLRDRWVDRNPPRLRGNSQGRRARVTEALGEARGRVDLTWAQDLMRFHSHPAEAICRHPEPDARTITISSVLFLPQQRAFLFANGQPCQVCYDWWTVGED